MLAQHPGNTRRVCWFKSFSLLVAHVDFALVRMTEESGPAPANITVARVCIVLVEC